MVAVLGKTKWVSSNFACKVPGKQEWMEAISVKQFL